VGNDYPRLIALSHPLLRPSTSPKAIRRYSQQFVDLIDLEDNTFKTLPVHDVLGSQYPPLRYLAQLEEDDFFISLRSNIIEGDLHRLVLTFDELLRLTPFAAYMREMLSQLERKYRAPVDMEFAAQVHIGETGKPQLRITILQCRPQSHLMEVAQVAIPTNLPQEDLVFSTRFVVPQGHIDSVEYVLFVPPEEYFALPTAASRTDLARTIGRLNAKLEKISFICVGPGRWGSSNSDLGVPIDYGDIYNTRSLVELAGRGGPAPEPSLGTHFFQDLMEAQIYPLAIYLDDAEAVFNHNFFYNTPDHLGQWLQVDEGLKPCLRLIRVSDFPPNHHLHVVMNDEKGLAVAYLEKDLQ